MLRVLTVAAVFVAIGVGCASAPFSATPNACRGADRTSAQLIYNLGKYTTTTDSTLAAGRDSLRLPAVSESQIELVSDGRVCARAASAYGANVGGATSTLSRRVYVVRVGGTRYVVLDPAYRYDPSRTQFRTYVVMDTTYKVLVKYF